MPKTVSILFACFITVFFICASPATAGEAVTLFIESSTVTVMPFPLDRPGDDYPRLRAIALDADNEIAATFGGSPIADAALVVESQTFGTEIRVADKKVTDPATSLSFLLEGFQTTTLTMGPGWKEFALSYDNVDETGTDVLSVTLKNGSSEIKATVSIKVKAPAANCYIVRSGGITFEPDPMETLAATQLNDSSALRQAGQSTTLDIYAAHGRDTNADGVRDTYYFTDNVPECADEITVTGLSTAALAAGKLVVIESSGETLVDGLLKTDITVQDLHIPDILAALLDAGGTGADTCREQLDLMDSWLDADGTAGTEGVGITWIAASGATREVGTGFGDTGDDPSGLQVTADDLLHSDYRGVAGTRETDTSWYAPAPARHSSIHGLPVNGITGGGPRELGFPAPGGRAPSAAAPPDVCPLDGFFLKGNHTKSGIKSAGHVSQTYLYGAVIATDPYDNPASFGTNTAANHFYLSSPVLPCQGDGPGGASGPTIKVTETGNTLRATHVDKCFLPFRVSTDAWQSLSGEVYTVLDNLYIAVSGTDGNVSTNAYENIDSSGEGVDFVLQDYVEAVTITNALTGSNSDLAGREAGSDTEVLVAGHANEQAFEMRGVRRMDGAPVFLNSEGATSASTSVAIPYAAAALAAEDVAFFTATDPYNAMLLVFEGTTSGTTVMQPVSLTTGITPADPGDFELQAVFKSLDCVHALLDDEAGDHNTVNIQAGTTGYLPLVSALDGFGNEYASEFGSDLKASGLEPTVYKTADNGSATTTLFPAIADILTGLIRGENPEGEDSPEAEGEAPREG